MRGFLKSALVVSVLIAAPAAAVAASPITGSLGLGSVGGVNIGGGTASMAVFNAMGAGNVTFGTQTGSFSVLAPCFACVKFGSGVGANTTYTYSATYTMTGGGSDTTYTHTVTSALPFFVVTDGGVTSTFTPDFGGDLLIEKTLLGKTTSYSLVADGLLTLTGFAPTEGTFSLTTQGIPGSQVFASFSASADAAPAPLAGAGLISFGGAGLVALRKRGRRLMARLSSRLAPA